MDEGPEPRIRHIIVRRFASAAEADRHDEKFWAHLTPEERVLLAWHLSEELWRLRDGYVDEPGFSRPVARIHRR
jgi:hypothetical protein